MNRISIKITAEDLEEIIDMLEHASDQFMDEQNWLLRRFPDVPSVIEAVGEMQLYLGDLNDIAEELREKRLAALWEQNPISSLVH